MNKWFLFPALCAALVACSIKEDRSDCPCYLDVVPDARMEESPDGRLIISVFNGAQTAYRDVFSQEQVSNSDYGEIKLRRGVVNVNALWGVSGGFVKGHRYILPEGSQMDSLYASTRRGVDATGESAVASIFGAKQFCTVRITLASGSQSPELSLVMRGNTAGMDLLTLAPVPGRFRACALSGGISDYAVRVPRQVDDSLSLDFCIGVETVAGFELGKCIARMGYDWSAESLDDIGIEIDFAHARISVTVKGWEVSWAYSIEI